MARAQRAFNGPAESSSVPGEPWRWSCQWCQIMPVVSIPGPASSSDSESSLRPRDTDRWPIRRGVLTRAGPVCIRVPLMTDAWPWILRDFKVKTLTTHTPMLSIGKLAPLRTAISAVRSAYCGTPCVIFQPSFPAIRQSFVPALNSRCFATSFLPKAEVSERVMIFQSTFDGLFSCWLFLKLIPSLIKVLKVVKNFQNVDAAKVAVSSHFQNDLGLDSLDTVEVRASLCPS